MKRILPFVLFLFSFSAYGQTSDHSQTVLTWDATPSTVLSVTLERKNAACAATGSFSVVGNVTAPTRVYVDSSVTQGVTYCYRAFSNGAGNQVSGYSNTVERTVPFVIPPAPQNLRTQ